MDDASTVSLMERVDYAGNQCERRLDAQSASGQSRCQGVALDILHRYEVPTVCVLADLVNGADIRVIQSGRRPCFAE